MFKVIPKIFPNPLSEFEVSRKIFPNLGHDPVSLGDRWNIVLAIYTLLTPRGSQ